MALEVLSRLVTFLFGYRDPLPQDAAFSMGAESEIPPESDRSAVRGPWTDGDEGEHGEGDLDWRVPRIMEDVKRYIRSIDISTL